MALGSSSTLPSCPTPSSRVASSSELKLRSASSSLALAAGREVALLKRSRSPVPRLFVPLSRGLGWASATVANTAMNPSSRRQGNMARGVSPKYRRIATAWHRFRCAARLRYRARGRGGRMDRAGVLRAVSRLLQAQGLEDLFAGAEDDAPALRRL